MAVGESAIRLFEFGVGLYSMTHGQHGLIIQFQLCRKFSRGFAFAYASHEENDLARPPLTALKDCASVQIVNCAAMLTAMYFEFAGLGAPKPSGLLQTCLALGTFQSRWMEMFENPLCAIFWVK